MSNKVAPLLGLETRSKLDQEGGHYFRLPINKNVRTTKQMKNRMIVALIQTSGIVAAPVTRLYERCGNSAYKVQTIPRALISRERMMHVPTAAMVREKESASCDINRTWLARWSTDEAHPETTADVLLGWS
jgi:hypothetical protein